MKNAVMAALRSDGWRPASRVKEAVSALPRLERSREEKRKSRDRKGRSLVSVLRRIDVVRSAFIMEGKVGFSRGLLADEDEEVDSPVCEEEDGMLVDGPGDEGGSSLSSVSIICVDA